MVQNQAITRYTVAVDGTDNLQCLHDANSSCKTMEYIIDNACDSHQEIALDIKYQEIFIHNEPCAQRTKERKYDCFVTVSGSQSSQKSQIALAGNNQSDMCNIFQHLMQQGNNLKFVNLVVLHLLLVVHGQADFSAENVDFVDFQFSVNGSLKLPCSFDCKFCSFSTSSDMSSRTLDGSQIGLSHCQCVTFVLQNSLFSHARGTSFVKILNPGQAGNFSHSVIEIHNCSMTNNTGSSALLAIESSCFHNAGAFMQVFLDHTLFEGNRVYLSPVFFLHCFGSKLLQIEKMAITNCTFLNNMGGKAGVISLEGVDTLLLVTNSLFMENIATSGSSTDVEVSGSSIDSDDFENMGKSAGCIYFAGTECSLAMTISNSKFQNNMADGMLSAGSVHIDVGSDSYLILWVSSTQFFENLGGASGSVYIAGFGSTFDFRMDNSEFSTNTGYAWTSAGSVRISAQHNPDSPRGASCLFFSVFHSEFHKNTGEDAGSFYIDGFSSSLHINVTNSHFNENMGTSTSSSAGSILIDGGFEFSLDMNVTGSEFDEDTGWYTGSICISAGVDSSLLITVSNNQFQGNTGERTGSVYVSIGEGSSLSISVTTCEFYENTGSETSDPPRSAGALNIYGEKSSFMVRVENNKFCENMGGSGSVRVYGDDSSVHIGVSNCVFHNNIGRHTGSIYIVAFRDCTVNTSVISNEFFGNTGRQTGVLHVVALSSSSLTMSLTHGDFSENTGSAGAVQIVAHDSYIHFSVTESSFSNNRGEYGGALAVESYCSLIQATAFLHVLSSEFVGNTASHGGSATEVLVECTLNETAAAIIIVNNTNISHNVVPEEGFDQSGGALLLSTGISPSRTIVLITKCTWENNTSSTYGGALALSIYESSIVFIGESKFISNSAAGVTSNGGACYLHVQKVDEVGEKGKIEIDECIFEHNVAADGGSIFQTSQKTFETELTIENTIFFCCKDLEANFISVMISSELKNTQFFHTFQQADISTFGIFLKFEGPYVLHNVSLSCHSADILLSMNSVKISKEDIAYLSGIYSDDTLYSLSAYCAKCSVKPFAAGNGSLEINLQHFEQSDRKTSLLFQHNVLLHGPCQPCPFGGVCSNGQVKALPNYWGYKKEQLIFFLSCPPQYCCNGIDVPCDAFDTCAPHRTGQLCGKCEEGFTESLMSTVCIEDKTCDDWWIWPLVFVLAFGYLMWYMFRGNISVFCQSIFRITKVCAADASGDAGDILSKQASDHAENAYFDILVYFGNIVSLLHVQVQFETSDKQAGILMEIEKHFVKYLNVDVQQIFNFELCPLAGIDVTMKAFSRPLFTFSVFLTWCALFAITILVLYIVHFKLFCKLAMLRKILSQFRYKLLEGFVETAKYGYTGFAGATFVLLTCIHISDKSFWKYDAEIECYSTLQHMVMLFAALYTIPFVFVSPIAGKLLRSGTVGHIQVMFACMFPLPVIAFWGFRYILLPVLSKRQVWPPPQQFRTELSHSKSKTTCHISQEAQVLLNTYQSPYKAKYSFWEGVIELRKLIFCSFYLVSNNIYRLLYCTIFCVVTLVHHNSAQPFANVKSNRAETLSLSLLCVACITNGIKSVFSQLGLIVEPNTPTEQLLFLVNRLDRILVIILVLYILFLETFYFLHKMWVKQMN